MKRQIKRWQIPIIMGICVLWGCVIRDPIGPDVLYHYVNNSTVLLRMDVYSHDYKGRSLRSHAIEPEGILRILSPGGGIGEPGDPFHYKGDRFYGDSIVVVFNTNAPMEERKCATHTRRYNDFTGKVRDPKGNLFTCSRCRIVTVKTIKRTKHAALQNAYYTFTKRDFNNAEPCSIPGTDETEDKTDP